MSKGSIIKSGLAVMILIVCAVIIYTKAIPSSNISRVVKKDTASTQWTPNETELKEALGAGKPAMILFHSNTCKSCLEMSETVAKIKNGFSGRVAFVDVLVNDERERRFIERFGVAAIPTSVFIAPDGELLDKVVGTIDKDVLQTKLNSMSEM